MCSKEVLVCNYSIVHIIPFNLCLTTYIQILFSNKISGVACKDFPEPNNGSEIFFKDCIRCIGKLGLDCAIAKIN